MAGDGADRFDAAAFAAVTLLTLGAVLGNGVLFAAAVVPGVYLSAEALAAPPAPSAVSIERTIESGAVAPGQRTAVTLTVTNEGDRPLPDLRLVDRPPEAVSVVEGAPRACVSVRPGESESVTYEAVAGHGEHAFDDPIVRVRSLSAVGHETGRVTTTGDSVLTCGLSGEPAVRSGSRRQVGTRPADAPGGGLEFHSLREYRHGDDASRVDWRHFAKTGDLSTVNFREPHASGTVVVADDRRPGRVGREAGRPTAAELSVDAAEQLFARLADADNRVGLAALGVSAADVDAPVASDGADRPWVPVGSDATTRTQAAAVLEAAAAVGEASERSAVRSTDGVQDRVQSVRADALRERLPGSTAVVVATPLLDDGAVALVEALSATGHPVLAVSPDVTGGSTPGQRVVTAERRVRIERLRAGETTVVDWDVAEPLAVAMEGSA
jgi:uncharacterized protein (DUF58 family)